MNLCVLKKSRKALHAGDVFAWRVAGHDFGFGRVVRTDCVIDGCHGVILIYLYADFARAKDEIPRLEPPRLLIPPILINRLPWSHGYFEHVTNVPLTAGQLVRHCFRNPALGGYYDDNQKRLLRRTEPCGMLAFDSFKTIDVGLSMALGIEPSPDTLPPEPKPRGRHKAKK